MIEWVTVNHRRKKTYAMTILAKPESHPEIVEVVIQMGKGESDMYRVTYQWIVTPMIGMLLEEDDKLEWAMGANSADFQERTYVDITGVSPQIDLFTAIPRKPHMHGEDGLFNVQTIAKILL